MSQFISTSTYTPTARPRDRLHSSALSNNSCAKELSNRRHVHNARPERHPCRCGSSKPLCSKTTGAVKTTDAGKVSKVSHTRSSNQPDHRKGADHKAKEKVALNPK
jgi:hypothetical protein